MSRRVFHSRPSSVKHSVQVWLITLSLTGRADPFDCFLGEVLGGATDNIIEIGAVERKIAASTFIRSRFMIQHYGNIL